MAGKKELEFRPSAAERWDCTASVHHHDPAADKPTQYSTEGTLAHSVLSTLLETGEFEGYDVGTVHVVDGFKLTVTDEMHECALAAKAYIEKWLGTQEAHRLVECKVTATLTHMEDDDDGYIYLVSGTADAMGMMLSNESARVLHVFDYKYGKGELVEVRGNLQCALYGIGSLDTFSFYWPDRIDYVNVHIIQPRHPGARDNLPWSIPRKELEELRAKFAARIHEAHHNPQFRPSDKACRWCNFQACAARAEYHQQKHLVDFEDYPDTDSLVELTPERIAELMRWAPDIRNWLSDIEAAAARIAERDPVACEGHLKMVAGRRGNRAWSNPDKVEEVLVKARAGESMWEKKLVSPTQAEKRLTAGRWKRVQEFVVRPPGKPVVALWDDPRPALDSGFEVHEDEHDPLLD